MFERNLEKIRSFYNDAFPANEYLVYTFIRCENGEFAWEELTGYMTLRDSLRFTVRTLKSYSADTEGIIFQRGKVEPCAYYPPLRRRNND